MTAPANESPRISIKLDLSPGTYHYSNPQPPTLTLSLTSSAERPIVVAINYGSPLDPQTAMSHGGFPIGDLSTDPPSRVPTTDLTGKVNRKPSSPRYLSLTPGGTTAVFVAFTRGGSYDAQFRPEPWEVVRKGKLRDSGGKELNIRRPTTVAGVDGLEAGKRYKATVALSKLMGTRWWYGTEAEVRSGTAIAPTYELDGEEIQLPLTWEVEEGGVELSVED